jgi:ABC-2 type transport system permease protein
VAILIAFSFLIGYSPSAGVADWLLTVIILILALLAFSMMGVTFGLAAKTDEGSGMFSYLVIGLLFVSSGFAPTATMPAPLRTFADHQPMTVVIDAIRNAQLGVLGNGSTTAAILWLVGIAIAFGVLAALANRRLRLSA